MRNLRLGLAVTALAAAAVVAGCTATPANTPPGPGKPAVKEATAPAAPAPSTAVAGTPVSGDALAKVKQRLAADGISPKAGSQMTIEYGSDSDHVIVTGKLFKAPGQPGVEFKDLTEVDLVLKNAEWVVEKAK